jgi:hypothetical protein
MSRDHQDERKDLKFSTIKASNGIYISLGAFFHQRSALERRSIMKRLTIFGIIACVGLLFAPAAVISKEVQNVTVTNTPLPVTVQSDGISVNVSTVYQFVGFSDDLTDGNPGGVTGMHAICQTDFEDGHARMCTSKEYWTSPSAAEALVAAWIHPTVVGIISRAGGDAAIDFSGAILLIGDAVYDGFPTCARWTSIGSGTNGTTLISESLIVPSPCDIPRPVTCCAPANQ